MKGRLITTVTIATLMLLWLVAAAACKGEKAGSGG